MALTTILVILIIVFIFTYVVANYYNLEGISEAIIGGVSTKFPKFRSSTTTTKTLTRAYPADYIFINMRGYDYQYWGDTQFIGYGMPHETVYENGEMLFEYYAQGIWYSSPGSHEFKDEYDDISRYCQSGGGMLPYPLIGAFLYLDVNGNIKNISYEFILHKQVDCLGPDKYQQFIDNLKRTGFLDYYQNVYWLELMENLGSSPTSGCSYVGHSGSLWIPNPEHSYYKKVTLPIPKKIVAEHKNANQKFVGDVYYNSPILCGNSLITTTFVRGSYTDMKGEKSMMGTYDVNHKKLVLSSEYGPYEGNLSSIIVFEGKDIRIS